MEKRTTISFLGPHGTYSDEAADRFAAKLGLDPEQTEYIPHRSFSGVFDAVQSGKSDYGVVAIENSLEGAVTAALDDFVLHPDVEIVGEEVLDIHHNLLVKDGVSLDDVTTVVSHSQALAQCRQFLKTNFPNARQLTTGSTAESAKMAAADPHVASIASKKSAELYGLKIALRSIEDVSSDQTSFALIAPRGCKAHLQGGPEKTSLVLFLKENRAGALLMILEEFAYAGMNLSKIQSRPTKRVLGEYMFFIDVEGSLNDPALATALKCLELKLREIRILGCYPRFS